MPLRDLYVEIRKEASLPVTVKQILLVFGEEIARVRTI